VVEAMPERIDIVSNEDGAIKEFRRQNSEARRMLFFILNSDSYIHFFLFNSHYYGEERSMKHLKAANQKQNS